MPPRHPGNQYGRDRTLTVDRATTKTGVHRTFELCPRAVKVLRRQLALRERLVREGSIRHQNIFFADDGAPLRSIKAPGQRWAKSLARLPIRTRRPYCARHSCVSWNLMLGKNPLWVARQHGHTVRTMLEVYAAWADGAVESDVQVIRRSMELPDNSSTSAWRGLLGGLAQRLFGNAAEGRHAGPRFSIWHWIWHQERGACT